MSQFCSFGTAARILPRSMYANINLRKRPCESDSDRDRCSSDRTITLSPEVLAELRWWIQNIHTTDGQPIRHHLRALVLTGMLYTDASACGWGGFSSLTEAQIQQTANALLENLARKAPSSTPVSVVADLAARGIDTYSCLLYTSPSPRDRG
eukprot:947339-Rhodomonas_salina.1